MKTPKVVFDDSSATFELEAFNKVIDADGYIIDANTKERVTTPNGEELTLKEFGGIVKGKKNEMVFLKKGIF